MTDFENMVMDMEEAIDRGVYPPDEVKPFLDKNFERFPLSLQNKLVDCGAVGRQRCEVWSRVMGYFRPVDQWNAGKKNEHAERHHLTPNQL